MTKIETKNKYIEKKMNLFFFKILRVSFSERRAMANVKTNANMILSGEIELKRFPKLSIFISSNIKPPMIIGIDGVVLSSMLMILPTQMPLLFPV